MNRPGGDTARGAPAGQRQRGLPFRHPPAGRQRDGVFRRLSCFSFFVMPGLVPGIHVFRNHSKKDVDGRDEPGHDAEKKRRDLKRYSITAWSGASDCLRKEALVEPIMIASGIAHSVNSITIW